jgi:hypothetical protein
MQEFRSYRIPGRLLYLLHSAFCTERADVLAVCSRQLEQVGNWEAILQLL